jgi:hypothetical protein
VQLWEVKDLHFSDGYTKNKTVRVVIAEERWTEKRVVGGQKCAKPQQSQWMWVACEGLSGYAAEVIYQGGPGAGGSKTRPSTN